MSQNGCVLAAHTQVAKMRRRAPPPQANGLETLGCDKAIPMKNEHLTKEVEDTGRIACFRLSCRGGWEEGEAQENERLRLALFVALADSRRKAAEVDQPVL
jgi:hypothetical protein